MKVRDILRTKGTDIITTTQTASLLEASRLLSEHNIGVVLVTDPKGEPKGILSERDIVREFASRGGTIEGTPVEEAMAHDLIVAEADDDLNYVMSVMTQERIRHLPIVDEGKLAGLVSIGDVVKAHVTQAEIEIRLLQSYITGTPL